VSALPTDPERLFGAEALTDLRALRRAYARLLREHGPENDPAGFQVVNAAYEAARARLEAPPTEPVSAIADPPSRDAEAWTAWLRADATSIDAVRDELARSPHDARAGLLRLAAEAALDPDATAELALVELARRRIPSYVVGRIAMALDPRLATDGWDRWSADPRASDGSDGLGVARLDALVHERAWTTAWAHWRAIGPHLVLSSPAEALRRYALLLGVMAWRLPIEAVRAERLWIHDAEFAFDLDALRSFDARLRRTLDARASLEASDVAPPVRSALARLLGGDGVIGHADAVITLARMRDGLVDPRAELERMSRFNPDVVHALVDPVLLVSGRARHLRRIAPLPPRDDVAAALVGLQGGLVARKNAAETAGGAWTSVTIVGLLAAMIAIIGLMVLVGRWAAILFFFVLLWYSRVADRTSLGLTPADHAWADAECLRILREHGVWAHELAAAGSAIPELGSALDRLMRDPWADLLALDVRHAHRALLVEPSEDAP
jgi:hypothetical protein